MPQRPAPRWTPVEFLVLCHAFSLFWLAPAFGKNVYQKLPVSDYLSVATFDDIPSRDLKFNSESLKNVVLYSDGSTEVYLGGTVEKGEVLVFNGKPVEVKDDGTWEFNIPLPPAITTLKFELAQSGVVIGAERFLVAWKQQPPSFRLQIKDESDKTFDYSMGAKDFNAPPFVQLYLGGDPIESAEWNGNVPTGDLSFKVVFPDRGKVTKERWALMFFTENRKTVFRTLGTGAPPASISWDQMKIDIQPGTHYFYKFVVMLDKLRVESPERPFSPIKPKYNPWEFRVFPRALIQSIDENDPSNPGNTASLDSNISAGMGLEVDYRFDELWDMGLEFSIDRVTFAASTSRTVTPTTIYPYSVAAFGRYQIHNPFWVGLRAGARSEFFLSDVSPTDTVDLLLNGSLIPFAGGLVGYTHDFSVRDRLEIEAGANYLLGATAASYTINSGYSVYGKATYYRKFGSWTGLGALCYDRVAQNTSLTPSTISTYLLQVGVEFTPLTFQ